MKIRTSCRVSRCAAALVLAATGVAGADRRLHPPVPRSTSSRPKDGAKVKGPVTVVFGLKGMGIAPAGIKFDNTGHHHLLIDSERRRICRSRCPPMKRACISARARPKPR